MSSKATDKLATVGRLTEFFCCFFDFFDAGDFRLDVITLFACVFRGTTGVGSPEPLALTDSTSNI